MALSQLVLWVTPAHALVVDRIAAVAGEHIIMLSEVRERAAVYMIAPSGEKDPLARAKLEAKAMRTACEELIDDALVRDEAERLHVAATDDEVNHALDEVAKSNNLDRAGLIVAARDQGVTETSYREMLREQLLQGKLLVLRKATAENVEQAATALRAELRGRVYVEDRVAAP